MVSSRHSSIVIIGSGFGGLGIAIRLKQEGFSDFIVLERAQTVGGTWRDNTYPGCACDVESNLYSFSFAPNPDWSRLFSPQAEILAYLKDCADRFGILPYIRFNHAMSEAFWDEGKKHWTIETSQGRFTSDVLITAMGAFSEPSVPKLQGLQKFAGKTFHSARWAHDYDLSGRNVAVIGSGASAIQFIPEIQPRVRQLTVYQRTPPWVVPRMRRGPTETEKARFRKYPILQKLRRFQIYLIREYYGIAFRHPSLMRFYKKVALRHLKRAVKDPALVEKLTPSYQIGCKRILSSNNYYPSLTHKNVEVVTAPLQEIRERSIVTRDKDGVESEREVDTIIFGTGFQVTEMPFADRIRGRAGQSLGSLWRGSPQAHRGTTVVGFPNLFILLGPNTGLGHNSIVLMLEAQFAHILKAIRAMRKRNAATLEPRLAAQDAYQRELDRRNAGTVWIQGGCRSWYLDSEGRNSTLWPSSVGAFSRRTRPFRAREFDFAGSRHV